MKKILIILISISSVLYTHAQIEKLAGPRLGAVLINPGISSHWINKERSLWDEVSPTINDDAKSALISLYGWQWESRFADGGDITGIVEWIALVGGTERGKFIPSISSMVGIRTAKGIEFAVGPNLSLSGVAIVLGAGYNIKSGKLNIPVNIAFVPGSTRKIDAKYEYEDEWYAGEDGLWNTADDEYITTETLIHEEFLANIGSRISITFGFNLNREAKDKK